MRRCWPHEDLARALLDVTLTIYDRQGRHEDLMRILERVAKRLQGVGFHPKQTEEVWLELQERYQRGWSMLRNRRAITEREADGI